MNNSINKLKNSNNSRDNLSLVLWGNILSSTTRIRYTKHELSIVKLPEKVRSVIVGIILSDGHIALTPRSKNAYLIFSQSLAKLTYVYFVFHFLNHYCQSSPRLSISNAWGKTTYQLKISTRSMLCITELHKFFYENRIKVIRPSIYFYITPIALAHWIMGDGTFTGKSLLLCTDSFSIKEVVLLNMIYVVLYSIILKNTLEYIYVKKVCLNYVKLFCLICMSLCYIN